MPANSWKQCYIGDCDWANLGDQVKYLKIKKKKPLLECNHKTTALFLLVCCQYFAMRLSHKDSLSSLKKHMNRKSVCLRRRGVKDWEIHSFPVIKPVLTNSPMLKKGGNTSHPKTFLKVSFVLVIFVAENTDCAAQRVFICTAIGRQDHCTKRKPESISSLKKYPPSTYRPAYSSFQPADAFL